MASIGRRFDATEHDTDKQGGSFVKPPEGIYKMEVTESSVKDEGEKVRATFKVTIIAPEAYKESFVYFNPWIQHPTAMAQEIGQRDLARLCRAVEVPSPEDTDELHFKPFVAELKNGKPYQAKKDGIPLTDDAGQPVMRTNLEIRKFFYPDDGPAPELELYDAQPAANDNTPAARPAQQRPAPANDNAPAPQQAATASRSRPWKK